MAEKDENATSRQFFATIGLPLGGMSCRHATPVGKPIESGDRAGRPDLGSASGNAFSSASLAAEEHPVRRIGGLVDVVIAEAIEEPPKLRAFARRDLHADEHAAIVGAVVAVVKETDVPAGAHAVEEAHQRARSRR